MNRKDLLDADAILNAMDVHAGSLVTGLHILTEVDSTNLYLMRAAAGGAPGGTVCLAEQQSAGRGQRGRIWASPCACNIYLSILWKFTAAVRPMGLSMAIGVSVARALRKMGITDTDLKWPNDVLWQGRKLAGILIDMTLQASGEKQAVIGVGLNVAMPAESALSITQPWTDVQSALGKPVARNRCAGLLLQELLYALNEFQISGFASFREEWEKLDVLAGKQVNLHMHDKIIGGIAQGIDADGALRILADGIVRSYSSGTVSVRLVDMYTQTSASVEKVL